MNHLVKSEEIKKMVLENILGMEKLEKCIMAVWLIKTSGGSKKSVSVEVSVSPCYTSLWSQHWISSEVYDELL